MILTSTGIHIGCKYQPVQHHDQDAVRLQSALLGNKSPIDWDGIIIVAVMIFFVVVAFIANY